MLRYFPLLLLLPAVAVGQTAEVVTKLDAKLDAERSAQRSEDVEILRRLLNKACGLPDRNEVRSYKEPPRSWAIADQNSFLGKNQTLPTDPAPFVSGPLPTHTTLAAVGPFDGVYLPGAGVVFTLHVPAGVPRTVQGERIGLNSSCNTCHQPQVHVSLSSPVSVSACTSCHSELPKTPALLSDWDRTKMDVRGEKPKEPVAKLKDDKTVAVCEPGSLHNLISSVLAANAKNVRHLGEKEAVTVVVTFDEVSEKAVAPSGVGYSGTSPSVTEQYFRMEERLKERQPPTKSGFTAEEVKALTLGDLHLKQGKHREACDAYDTALARFTDKEFKLSGLTNFTPEQRKQYADEFQKGVRDAMKSYAKALLLADQPDKAKAALELATGFVVLEATPTTVPAKSTAPAKLIVTVSKADLDAAKDAAGMKKAVKAERVNFPTEGKK